MRNAMDDDSSDFLRDELPVFLNGDGRCEWLRQIHIKSECDGIAKDYPYDKQSCTIKFISRANPTGIRFELKKRPPVSVGVKTILKVFLVNLRKLL